MRLLVIEDDGELADFLIKGLKEAGHQVVHAANGHAGLAIARATAFDALVVDRMLPQLDGLALVRQLREEASPVPVLFLSALGEVDDRVQGLRAGGDDYLVKPFAFNELQARLEALCRRASAPASAPSLLTVGDLRLDCLKREVHRAQQAIDLQPREFRLLEYLMRHAGQVVTRAMLLEHVWDYHFDPQTNVIDVHISRLRAKIDKGFDSPLLHTVRGAGYKMAG